MICKKDVGDGKAFWTAATAARVILPNGEKAELEPFPSLTVPYRSKPEIVFMLDDLEDQLQDVNDEGVTSLQYELDMFREDFDDFLTPEQVEWFDRMYDTVSAELDARWLLKKLEERHIVRIERG